MAYPFLARPLAAGAYEPEGIYLSLPLRGTGTIVQFWAEHNEYYAQFRYNGIALKGHNGLDFLGAPDTEVVAVDAGRITEIGEEHSGWGRYVKIEHSWGESFYAHLATIFVDSGQIVSRSFVVATIGASLSPQSTTTQQAQSYLHFGIRIRPYNRFDGWGGFVDPLPYLDPQHLNLSQDSSTIIVADFLPHPMSPEYPQMRRP